MNAKIISVINQKGGCGKTTIAMNLAGTLKIRHNKKVLIVDGDSQASATKWAGCASEETPFPCNVISLANATSKAHRSIRNFMMDYDFIIIDCSPNKFRLLINVFFVIVYYSCDFCFFIFPIVV